MLLVEASWVGKVGLSVCEDGGLILFEIWIGHSKRVMGWERNGLRGCGGSG